MIGESGQVGPDENELEEIIAHIPTLLDVRQFAKQAENIPWFRAVGERADNACRGHAHDYLGALGFPYVEPAFLQDWADAAAAAESMDFDCPDWEAEELLRSALVADALSQMEESALHVALTHVSVKVGAVLEPHLEDIGAIWELNDVALLNAAAGAAVRASHQAALVLAAGAEPDHPFALKFKLFELGRWPVGIAGASFNIF